MDGEEEDKGHSGQGGDSRGGDHSQPEEHAIPVAGMEIHVRPVEGTPFTLMLKPHGKEGGDKDKKGEGSKSGSGDGKGDDKKPMSPRKKRILIIIAVIVGILIIIAGLLYWLHARHYENTDDAFIDGHSSQVAPQVSGPVKALLIVDNQQVKAGDLLVEIDPRDYEVRLQQAEATQAQAEAQVVLQQANVDQAEANVSVAEAEDFQAERDLARFKAVDPKAVTHQQIDTAIANAKSSSAKLKAAQQQVEASRAQKEAAEASVQQAEADVNNAQLQLSYTRITAPVDGHIAKRTVEVGNIVAAGTPLMAVVSNDLWVTANFKETQLNHMRPGQKVRIEVDSFPKVDFQAHVDSIQRGTGEVFSILPAENATGNYVKVVQRIPVKIVFDDPRQIEQYPLSPGMSVEPRVEVR